MDISRIVANLRKAAGTLALSGGLIGSSAAMADSLGARVIAASTPLTQIGTPDAAGSADERFRNQFRAWQAHDGAGPPVLARISVGSMPPRSSIAIHTDSGLDHVTFGRALDAEGAPIDFSRIRVSLPNLARRTMGGSLAQVAMPSRLPLAGSAMTSGFGTRQHPIYGGRRAHSGIELAAPTGTPIYATADGMVGRAQWQGGYGLFVEMEHGGGLQTRFGHMSRLNVVAGQQLRKGDIVGYVGSTGLSTGPHLHYEIRVNGQAVNPASGGRR